MKKDKNKGDSSNHKGIKRQFSEEHRKRLSEAHKRYYQTHPGYWSGKKLPSEMVEKQRQGRLNYYQKHDVWNKGKPWSEDVKEKISGGCLSSIIGMGPKTPSETAIVGEEGHVR